jgi:hypothetical protein
MYMLCWLDGGTVPLTTESAELSAFLASTAFKLTKENTKLKFITGSFRDIRRIAFIGT